jgi:hypothetical protein
MNITILPRHRRPCPILVKAPNLKRQSGSIRAGAVRSLARGQAPDFAKQPIGDLYRRLRGGNITLDM